MGGLSTARDAALFYAAQGLAVLPLAPGKKIPLNAHGVKEATTDEKQIAAWWNRNPEAGVGIATGKRSGGLVVIDVDMHEGKDGLATLKRWEAENGQLAHTASDTSENGGIHFYYFVENDADDHADILGKGSGVDVRAGEHYVVAPPSNGRYWRDPLTCLADITPASGSVEKLINFKKSSEQSKRFERNAAEIEVGGRTDHLVSYIGQLVHSSPNLDDDQITALVRAENDLLPQPLTEDEITREVLPAINNLREKERREAIEEDFTEQAAPEDPILTCRKDGSPLQTLANVVEALAKDEKTRELFRYNQLSEQIEITGAWWPRSTAEIMDADLVYIRIYLEKKYGLTRVNGIPDAVDAQARRFPYHPVKQALEAITWDGSSRIADFLPKYLGADRSEYTTEATKLMLLGAVARLYEPGVKFDTMVCLVDNHQGGGKSTIARLLALSDEWYTDDVSNLDDDKIYSKLSGHWIIELSEMLATTNSKTIEAIKSTLSRQYDNYRVPYARYPRSYPRQCVFIGTTNNLDFLPDDKTGNRRFIPIRVNSRRAEAHPLADVAETRSYISQLWAEILKIYRSGNYELTLPKKFDDQLEQIREEFTPEDANIGIIQEWLDNYKDDQVCGLMLYEKALGHYTAPKPWDLKSIASIMDNKIDGWERSRSAHGKLSKPTFEEYGRQKAWRRISSRN